MADGLQNGKGRAIILIARSVNAAVRDILPITNTALTAGRKWTEGRNNNARNIIPWKAD